MCKGDCEGMRYVPVKIDDIGYEQKWLEAEIKDPLQMVFILLFVMSVMEQD